MAIEDVVVASAYRKVDSALARNLFKGSKDPVAQEKANQIWRTYISNNALKKLQRWSH